MSLIICVARSGGGKDRLAVAGTATELRRWLGLRLRRIGRRLDRRRNGGQATVGSRGESDGREHDGGGRRSSGGRARMELVHTRKTGRSSPSGQIGCTRAPPGSAGPTFR